MGERIRLLATGGTIAGTTAANAPQGAYTAAQLDVGQLLEPLMPRLQGLNRAVEARQVLQIDSCNLTLADWQLMAQAVQAAQDDPAVGAVVLTHGTDTLEETAVWLSGAVRGRKPVVLTGAMRPATATQPDGPDNLVQALYLACEPGLQGLWVAMAGQAWPGPQVRKVHPWRLDAFMGGDAPAAAQWAGGQWDWSGPRAAPEGAVVDVPARCEDWPVVVITESHGGVDPRALQALLQAADPYGRPLVQGVVVAATGNGTVHEAVDRVLRQAVRAARLRPDAVWVASRCTAGWVQPGSAIGWTLAADLTPAQARVRLMLSLMARSGRA